MKKLHYRKSSAKHPKGFIVIEPREENLIQLLDEGKIDEFRRRVTASTEQRRKQMFARVIAGR